MNKIIITFEDHTNHDEDFTMMAPVPSDDESEHAIAHIVHKLYAFLCALGYSTNTIEKYVDTDTMFDDFLKDRKSEDN